MKREKSYELKNCTECGTEYKHYPTKLMPLCEECTKKHRNKRNRLKPEEFKKGYPIPINERKRRYTRLRQGLQGVQLMSREEKTKYWDMVLKEIEELGILKWCIDLRHPPKVKNPGSGMKGRVANADPNKKWPDTRMKYDNL